MHADVFRPPVEMPMLFCVLVGTGMQLFISAFFLIVFAAVGFLSPANRGSIMIGTLLLFVLLGAVAGFTSARLYKTFKATFSSFSTVILFLILALPFHSGKTMAEMHSFNSVIVSGHSLRNLFSSWYCCVVLRFNRSGAVSHHAGCFNVVVWYLCAFGT